MRRDQAAGADRHTVQKIAPRDPRAHAKLSIVRSHVGLKHQLTVDPRLHHANTGQVFGGVWLRSAESTARSARMPSRRQPTVVVATGDGPALRVCVECFVQRDRLSRRDRLALLVATQHGGLHAGERVVVLHDRRVGRQRHVKPRVEHGADRIDARQQRIRQIAAEIAAQLGEEDRLRRRDDAEPCRAREMPRRGQPEMLDALAMPAPGEPLVGAQHVVDRAVADGMGRDAPAVGVRLARQRGSSRPSNRSTPCVSA